MPFGGTGGGPGSSVGGAAGDNGNRSGGGSRDVYSYDAETNRGTLQTVRDSANSANRGSHGNNGNGGSEGARQAAARAAAAAAERQRQIAAENKQRADLQTQLQQAETSEQVRAIQEQIGKLGTLAPNAAASNKALSTLGAKSLADAVGAERNNAIGAAQATSGRPGQAAIGAAQGTPVTAARQAYNTAEANRMGGYDDRTTLGRVGSVAKSTLSGLTVGGIPGAVVGAAAGVYNNFVNNTRQAGSSTQTANMDATRPTVGNALAGMATGALSGAAFGPLGVLGGAVWGGMQAAGVAPSLDDLKGTNPNVNGQTTNTGSFGPGQTLVNGVRVGQGNQKPTASTGSQSGGIPNISAGGATATPGGQYKPPTQVPANPGDNPLSGQESAGQGAFNKYLQDLRQRQLDNLLSTGAGSSRTSGTALLGRVGASQGAIGGLSGYVQTSLGGGKSLLGGAWQW